MSHGIFKNTDGEYCSPKASDVIPATIFEDQAYVGSSRSLNEANIPLMEVNKIIAELLKEIQDASFASTEQGGLDNIPLTENIHHNWLHKHCSSLHPVVLSGIIRKNLAVIIRKIIKFLPEEEQQKLQGAVEEADKVKAETNIPQANLVKDTDFGYLDILKNKTVMTDEARILLDGFREGYADKVEGTLKWYGPQILGRAELSLISVATDTESLFTEREEDLTGYSTLDPDNLIEMIKRDIKYIIGNLHLAMIELQKKVA